ncbi:MAG: universal stress protein [Bacteriovorax sp.]|jgi:nucleotide-binding universal stress UspA family protein
MKNIVVCVDLREESLKVLQSLKDRIDLSGSTVHLVHVFEIKMGLMEFTPVVYPVPSQYEEIESSIMGFLDNLKRDLGLKDNQVEKHCFFSQSKEQKIKEYLEDKKADMVILSTRGKHGIEGFFASSLADFLCKYSPCDMLVMRPR